MFETAAAEVLVNEPIQQSGFRVVAFIPVNTNARAGILAGLRHDRVLASWLFPGRLAEGRKRVLRCPTVSAAHFTA